MRRILSLPRLVAAVWVACLAFLGLLARTLIAFAWHPHFLPVTMMLILVIVAGLALIVAASWRVIRGPGRLRTLSCLLIGAAPLWWLAGFFLYGVAINSARNTPLNPALKLLMALGESAMDLEARFRYPQWTYGETVVMISPPLPEAEARAQVAAMDRHVRALEARLGRKTTRTIHWARGPLLGIERHAIFGLCMGTRPGEAPADGEGLCTVDRHEIAHCVLNSQCSAEFDPPAMLTEGWARANQGVAPVILAHRVREDLEDGSALSLRRLTSPDWYDRHEDPAYFQGAGLVNFLLRRFGPEKFPELYTTCTQATFESDCRRILGLDLDGLDAAYLAEVDRLVSGAGPIERLRLEGLRLGPGVDAVAWKAVIADYFAATGRLLAPYRHVRLRTVFTRSTADGESRAYPLTFEVRLLRSGEFASLRRRDSGHELAFLARPRRSIWARRAAPDQPWELEARPKLTPDQFRHHVLRRIDDHDEAGRRPAALIALAADLRGFHAIDAFVVAAFERSTEGGRPRVRVRIENNLQGWNPMGWRANTYVLAADEFFAAPSERAEGVGPDNTTYQSNFTYDRHEGIPVLHSMTTSEDSRNGPHWTGELKVVERQFGPIPEEEFDPHRFLDGPQREKAQPDPDADEPSRLQRWYWLPFPIGTVGLIGGAVLSFGLRRGGLARRPLSDGLMHTKALLVALGVLGLGTGPAPARTERMSYLDNGTIRLGVDLDIGGTIAFLSRSKDGANLINSHDLGRQVQQSYYSGPHPFGHAHPGWKNWPWNPIASGHVYNHPSRVVEHSNDGKTLYTRTIPMQWALNNVPGNCTFETWITLENANAHVRCRLNNNRPDKTQYPAHGQELPAVYTIGKLHRLFTYDGDRPFQGQPLKRVQNAGPPCASWNATENWAALVDDRGIGVGLIHPGVYSFIGGFHGKPNTGGTKDNPTGYIAPVRKEVLDHNIVFEYRYILAVGTLEEIRAAAAANRDNDTRPDHRFDRDRRHWIYHNARDSGFPITGGLRIKTTSNVPQLIGPEQWWRAEDVPKLFIRAAFRTRSDRATIFWSVPGHGFSSGRRVELTIRPDGMLRTYEVDLTASPGYRGTITGLRLDLPDANGPDDEIRLESISWKTE